MFQTFTGSSRRPRQVNLSGRNTNPFAAVQQTSAARGSPNAVAQAQHERRARQQERERLQAAKTLQRTWRGYAVRHNTRNEYRQAWDEQDAYLKRVLSSEAPNEVLCGREVLAHLQMLLQFATSRNRGDVHRVSEYAVLFDHLLRSPLVESLGSEWIRPLSKLAKVILSMLELVTAGFGQGSTIAHGEVDHMVDALAHTVCLFPNEVGGYSGLFYSILGKLALSENLLGSSLIHEKISRILGLPLRESSESSSMIYEGLLTGFFTIPNIQEHLELRLLAKDLNSEVLTKTLKSITLSKSGKGIIQTLSRRSLCWLLAYFIYIRNVLATNDTAFYVSDIDFVAVVSTLLSHLAVDIGQQSPINGSASSPNPMPKFIQDQIMTLINQESITGLLMHSGIFSASVLTPRNGSDDASILAGYVLTLLQVFPRRSDEIRMWLYLGSTKASNDRDGAHSRVPAIRFFWEAVTRTQVYQDICTDSHALIEFLRGLDRRRIMAKDPYSVEQEWRIILIFLELYTFALKVMDDEEFMGANAFASQTSWTRLSALDLAQVKDLVTFLKNFAFAMYWYATELLDSEQKETYGSLASYFGQSDSKIESTRDGDGLSNSDDVAVPGIRWMTLGYLKGMVTGLLRMLYERDSRRKFLPKDHWLMKQFDMEGFIPEVVKEHAVRHEHGEEDEEADDTWENEMDAEQMNMVGTQRTQNVLKNEYIRRKQERASRRRRLEALLPRLGILENMPFFIPFTTRVEIFREFVTEDKLRRRSGFIDPDQWRFFIEHERHGRSRSSVEESRLGKQHAKVRREHVFHDAFNQFYQLGDGLKEPISIAFVDQFDTQEAGIDGGGVTKEFLTSVTSEAFTPNTDLNLFVENDQHLLFPNPTAIEERRDLVRQLGYKEGSTESRDAVGELLQQYEFLGRIVGKCLYEGILVDIHFAPFFLVKWALNGGVGFATNESGYRATINDVRDLDEELYQGLLKLKNYPGKVEDFSLDFTITDTIPTSGPSSIGHPKAATKTTTHELRPNGANIPVTNKNRLVYISYVARHRLQIQPRHQTSAFLKGLGSMIKPSWLSMFNQSELQTLIGGDSSEIDVPDLRRSTLYGGVYSLGDDQEEHPTVKMFWEVMQELSDEDRRKLLKYVTSTPRAPLLGFRQLNPRFSIRDSGSDQSRLPSTSTCVNLLKLPIYASKATLREKLVYAINAGAGFNLS